MSIRNTNKSGAIGIGAVLLAALILIFWAIAGEANWAGNFVGKLWIVAVLLFLFGVGYLFVKSGKDR